jgi:predicted AAA+ superfamily ATPase
MINRSFKQKIESRLAEESPLIQVLVGPRQVGKTTAIKQILSGRGLYFTADSPVPLDSTEIEKIWNRAIELPDPILAIDEIQKIPGWSEVIKKLWDTKTRKIKVLLSGSAALSIEKDLRESLAGRYELIRVEHWNFSEAHEAFGVTLGDYIEFGCYPGSSVLRDDIERWSLYIRDSIIEPAIGRDILQLHPVDNPALLRQVFSICVGHPSQIISLNKLQGQLQDRGALSTLQAYLELLSFGFLVTGVQKFAQNVLRMRQSPPKLIVHDNALIRAFERPIKSSPDSKRLGFYLENAVGARFIEAGWETYYWKDRDLEVDFIVLGPNGEKLAVEVKSSPPDVADLKGVLQFCRRHPEFQACVVCPVSFSMPGIRLIAAEKALSLSRQNPTLSFL